MLPPLSHVEIPDCAEKLSAIEQALRNGVPVEVLSDDLFELTLDLAREIGTRVDCRQLEIAIEGKAVIDYGAVDHGITLVEQLLSSVQPETSPTGVVVDPRLELAKIREMVLHLKERLPHATPGRIGFDLAVLCDSTLFQLLALVPPGDPGIEALEASVAKKLDLATDEQVMSMWASVTGEFADERPHGFRKGDARPGFFEYGTVGDVRGRIAEFLVHVKPALIRMRRGELEKRIPIATPGVLQVLSWSGGSSSVEISPRSAAVLRRIARLACIWSAGMSMEIEALAQLLGVEARGALLAGPLVEDLHKWIEKGRHVPTGRDSSLLDLLVAELRQLNIEVGQLVVAPMPIDRALRQHKLGLEVTLPDSRVRVLGTNEITLQKELCKFLLERGIPAIGTTFGPSQADLVGDYSGIPVVLEAKVLKVVVNERVIRSNLTQLQSYMDQVPVRPRGVLFIYNLTSTLILCPREWLQGRFLVMAVNLLAETPSNRTESVQIFEGRGSELIRLAVNQRNTQSKPRSSQRKTARTPRPLKKELQRGRR